MMENDNVSAVQRNSLLSYFCGKFYSGGVIVAFV